MTDSKRAANADDPWDGVDQNLVSAFRNSLIVNGKPAWLGIAGSAGPRYVIYQYCISVVILTFKRTSGIKMMNPARARLEPVCRTR